MRDTRGSTQFWLEGEGVVCATTEKHSFTQKKKLAKGDIQQTQGKGLTEVPVWEMVSYLENVTEVRWVGQSSEVMGHQFLSLW